MDCGLPMVLDGGLLTLGNLTGTDPDWGERPPELWIGSDCKLAAEVNPWHAWLIVGAVNEYMRANGWQRCMYEYAEGRVDVLFSWYVSPSTQTVTGRAICRSELEATLMAATEFMNAIEGLGE